MLGRIAFVVTIFGAVAGAEAQVPPPIHEPALMERDQAPPPPESLWTGEAELGLRVGFHSRSDDGVTSTSVSPVLFGSYRSPSGWGFHLAAPFVFLTANDDAGDAATLLHLGNLTAGGLRAIRAERVRATLALSIAVPVTAAPDGTTPLEEVARRDAFELPVAVRGGRSAWLFVPEQLGLVFETEAEVELSESFALVGDAELGLLLPTGDEIDSVQGLLGASAGIGWFHEDVASLRLALSLAYRSGPLDPLSTALRLSGRVQPSELFVDATFLVNLDEPYGPSFSGRGVWGLLVGMGVALSA